MGDRPFQTAVKLYEAGHLWLTIGLASLFLVWCIISRKEDRPRQTLGLALGGVLAIILVVYMATFPIPWDSGADRDWYAVGFAWRQAYVSDISEAFMHNDPFFEIFLFVLTRFLNFELCLAVIAIIYVGNYFWASYNFGKESVLGIFIAFIVSFGFFSYGISALRAGLGMSFLILGFSFMKGVGINKGFLSASVCFIFGSLFHLSIVISVLSIIFAVVIGKHRLKVCSCLWAVAFFVSLLCAERMGEAMQTLFGWGRTDYLVNAGKLEELNLHYNTGFRWSFVAFSLLPAAVFAFYRFVLGYRSRKYSVVTAAYLAANSVWLLVIRLPFTDRFAYLSWALMPLIIAGPLTDSGLRLRNKKVYLGCVLLLSSLFVNFVV